MSNCSKLEDLCKTVRFPIYGGALRHKVSGPCGPSTA